MKDLSKARKAKEKYKKAGRQKKEELVCFRLDGKEICLPADRISSMLESYGGDRSPWTIFKIMAEFVSGFEFLSQFDKAASFFGTARTKFSSQLYKDAEQLAFKLSNDGYAIVTGGGPGIMEAANKGANKAGGPSIGLNIKLKFEQRVNDYVTEADAYQYFFARKVMLSIASQVYIFFPGGFGTLDEFFEMVTLVQTEKIDPIPIVLVGKEYWTPLLDWIDERLYKKNKAVDKEDLRIYYLAKDCNDAYRYISRTVKFKKARI